MTRAQFLAICAAISSLGAGSALIYNYVGGTVDQTVLQPSRWEQLNASSCTSPGTCTSPICQVASNVLHDAGSMCAPILVDCDWRVSPLMRGCFADAGVTLGSQLYQRVELIDLRCPAADGGFAFGGPFDDAGCPVFPGTQVTPLCVRAPADGSGTTCQRLLSDGGAYYFGDGNVFPASQATGAGCQPVVCGVFAGDDPAVSL